MPRVHHAMPATLIAAVLAAGTAACGTPIAGSAYGTGTTTPTATPDPLAGLTGDQITERAIADLNDATSVRYTGTILDSDRNMSLNMTLVRGKGCEGSVNIDGLGGFQFVYDGKSVWVRFNDAFYKSRGVSAAEIPLLSGKWLKNSTGSTLGDLSSSCSISSIADSMGSQDTGMVKGEATSLNGQRVVMITQAGESGEGAIYVSDTAKPELLRLNSIAGVNVLGGGGSSGSTVGSVTFSGYDLPATITPPPASKTLNGNEFGSQIGPLMA